jgi:hypothetical protein
VTSLKSPLPSEEDKPHRGIYIPLPVSLIIAAIKWLQKKVFGQEELNLDQKINYLCESRKKK